MRGRILAISAGAALSVLTALTISAHSVENSVSARAHAEAMGSAALLAARLEALLGESGTLLRALAIAPAGRPLDASACEPLDAVRRSIAVASRATPLLLSGSDGSVICGDQWRDLPAGLSFGGLAGQAARAPGRAVARILTGGPGAPPSIALAVAFGPDASAVLVDPDIATRLPAPAAPSVLVRQPAVYFVDQATGVVMPASPVEAWRPADGDWVLALLRQAGAAAEAGVELEGEGAAVGKGGVLATAKVAWPAASVISVAIIDRPRPLAVLGPAALSGLTAALAIILAGAGLLCRTGRPVAVALEDLAAYGRAVMSDGRAPPGHPGFATAPRAIREIAGALDRLQASRRAAEHAAEQRREELFRVFDAGRDALLIVDERGRISEANRTACTVYRYARDELVGLACDRLTVPAGGATLGEFVARARAGRPFEVKARHRRRDGTDFDAEVSGQAMGFAGTTVVLATVRDVTDRMLSAERLRNAERMETLGFLTGRVAHDFGNLLQVILLNLELLEPHLRGDDRVEQIRGATVGAATRGADLIRQLLAFASRQPLAPERLEVAAVLDEMRAILLRRLDRGVRLTIQAETGLPAVYADRVQLEAAIMNLVVNAQDAMPAGGEVTVRVSGSAEEARGRVSGRQGDARGRRCVTIEVTDTGSGMSPEVRARIFEPFFTTKPMGKGVGLGLSSVFGFVRQSGGDVEVESQPQRGSTFRIRLPAEEAAGGSNIP